jgi:serine phosphatase RsbU (regulator of sigma subunit)
MLENLITDYLLKDVKDYNILEKIENVTVFAKNLLNADSVIVWFESEDRTTFWSLNESRQIYLEKDRIEPLFYKSTDVYLTKSEHLGFIKEMELISHKEIANTMLHKIECKECGHSIIIQTLNLHDEVQSFSRSVEDVLQILSIFISQTVKMRDISNLAKYYFEEQEKAYQKQKTVIKNDFDNLENPLFDIDIFYQPSDILSGDSYSILQANNGDILVYIVDAMGHGIGPSLTAYSISAIIQHQIKNTNNFSELMHTIMNNVQYILTDEEQLTCGFFWFSANFSRVEYIVAGMYAPMILDGNEIISAKANNIPFMNFAFDFSVTTIELQDFKRFLIFTDGLIEDTQNLTIDLEKMLIQKEYSKDIFNKLEYIDLEDDTTIVLISKK